MITTGRTRATLRSACRGVIALLVGTAPIACGGADTAGATADGHGGAWNITISPTALTLVQGQTGTVTVSIVGSPKGNVLLSVPGIPENVTATLSASSLSGSASSTLTIRPSLQTSAGMTSLHVVGVDGRDSSSVNLALTITLAPGVTVSRVGSGSGTVTSDPAGINCGSVCSTQFPFGTAVTLSATPASGSVFASWAGACSGTALTCTLTPVVNTPNSVTATFNTTAPGMAFAVSPTTVSVQQGSSATATATVTRLNGYTNPVALANNAPSGLTVAANPASVTGTSSTLTFVAAASLPGGNYPVTITATGAGVTQQTATLAVQVTPSSQGGAITMNYASCETSEIPIWFAVQSGSGPWTRITSTNNAFTFTPGATGAIAFVRKDGATTETQVFYASAAEFASIAIAGPCTYSAPTGTKRISGTWANVGQLSTGTRPRLVIGGATFDRTSDLTQSFSLTNVPKGARDLIFSRQAAPGLLGVQRMVLRRGTNYADNAQISIDAGGTESFIPAAGAITISSLPDTTSVEVSLITTNGGSAPYYSSFGVPVSGGNSKANFFGLPDTLLQTGDFHSVSVGAGSGTSFRFVQLITHSVIATTTAFGPSLGTGTKITTIGTTPNLRLRGQVPTVGTYTSGAAVDLQQNSNGVSLVMTAAYLNSTPTTWTVDVPDLSSAGYDATWGLKSGVGVSWNATAVSALNGGLLPFIGGAPVDNAQLTGAVVGDSSASFSTSRRFGIIRRPRP